MDERLRFAVLLAGSLAGSIARAGPPYVTDDPVPTDRGEWEIYPYVTGSRADGSTDGEAGLDLNYGAGDQVQLTLVLPAAWQGDVGIQVGMGTIQAAAKYRFVTQRDGSPIEVAVFPRLFLPVAQGEPSASHVSILLPVWFGHTGGPWYMFGGGGYQVNPGRGNRNFWTGGVALTRTLRDGIDVGGEVYGQTPDADHSESFLGFNVGIVCAVSPHWSFLASAGSGLVHAREQGQATFYVAMRADY
ncbi:MAG: hypothetical protein U1F08_09535 [Steroidobacteraceae bacterium]